MWPNLLGAVLAVGAVGAVACSHADCAQDNQGGPLILSIKMSEKTSADARPRILAEPTIAALAGRPFSFESGGIVTPKTGEGDLEIGTRITGKLERTANGMMQLALKVRIGFVVTQEDDPKTDLVRTEILEIRTILPPGETKRLKCSASQWCEIRVDDAR